MTQRACSSRGSRKGWFAVVLLVGSLVSLSALASDYRANAGDAEGDSTLQAPQVGQSSDDCEDAIYMIPDVVSIPEGDSASPGAPFSGAVI